MMARPMLPSQQKLAEKLVLISDRGVGMLTRIYNIKKVRPEINVSTKAKHFKQISLSTCFPKGILLSNGMYNKKIVVHLALT